MIRVDEEGKKWLGRMVGGMAGWKKVARKNGWGNGWVEKRRIHEWMGG